MELQVAMNSTRPFESAPQPLPAGSDQRTLHRRQIEGDRWDTGGVARSLGRGRLAGARWTDKHTPVGLVVLHPGEHGSGHFALDARKVRPSSRKRLLDLIDEYDHARRIDPCHHRSQESLHLVQTAQILKGLTTPPNRKPRRLLNDLPLALPEILWVKLSIDERHGERLLGGKARQAN